MNESALEVLVGAYLNQDVFDDYAGVLEAVDDFVRQDPELATTLPSEIDHVLLDQPDPAALEKLLDAYGIGFIAGEQGYRAWLQQIADRVRAATAG